MSDRADRGWVEDLIRRNRYVVLATSDGASPWVAPVEYLADDDLNLYFFSPDGVRHVRHIEANPKAAAAVFDHEQPDYTAATSVDLNGIQMECTVTRLDPQDYNEAVRAAVAALDPPMPPYAVFKIAPDRFFVPRIEDGVNMRYEVDMG